MVCRMSTGCKRDKAKCQGKAKARWSPGLQTEIFARQKSILSSHCWVNSQQGWMGNKTNMEYYTVISILLKWKIILFTLFWQRTQNRTFKSRLLTKFLRWRTTEVLQHRETSIDIRKVFENSNKDEVWFLQLLRMGSSIRRDRREGASQIRSHSAGEKLLLSMDHARFTQSFQWLSFTSEETEAQRG